MMEKYTIVNLKPTKLIVRLCKKKFYLCGDLSVLDTDSTNRFLERPVPAPWWRRLSVENGLKYVAICITMYLQHSYLIVGN